jgi:hypothetical protein
MLSAELPKSAVHGGKNLAQDAVQVFGLVIGDQIGKLINAAGMKLPTPVDASASTTGDTASRSAEAQQECLWQIAGPEWEHGCLRRR